MFAERLIEAEARVLGVERLGGIGIERAFVDVRTVRLLEGPSGEEAVDLLADARVGRQATSFAGPRDQDIAVYKTAAELQIAFGGKERVSPQTRCQPRGKRVLARGEDVTGLKEAASSED